MWLISKTDNASCPPLTSRRGNSLLPLHHHSKQEPRLTKKSPHLDPLNHSTEPTLRKHSSSRHYNNTLLLVVVACAFRVMCVYKDSSFIHCQWNSLRIYCLYLDLSKSVSFSVCHFCSFSLSLPLIFNCGRHDLPTQFMWSHFKVAMSSNTQLLRLKKGVLIETLWNLGIVFSAYANRCA